MNVKKLSLMLFFGSKLSFAIGTGVPTFDAATFGQMVKQIQKAEAMIKNLKGQLDAVTGNVKYAQQLYAEIADLKDEIRSMRKYLQLFKNPKELLKLSPTQRIELLSKIREKKYEDMQRSQDKIARLNKQVDETKSMKDSADLSNLINVERLKLEQRKLEIQVLEQSKEEAIKLSKINAVNLDACKTSQQLGDQTLAAIYCARVIDKKVIAANLNSNRDQTDSSIKRKSVGNRGKEPKGLYPNKVSEHFETGGKGPGIISPLSSRKLDHGGRSYGLAQLSTKQGSMAAYLKHTKYKELTKLKPDTPEFDAKWREIAARDPEGFAQEQREFTKRRYYDPAMAKLKSKGIDLSERGPAVQEMVWSTAVQYGNSAYPISRALKGKDISKMSDADIVYVVQEDKYVHRHSDFANSYKRGTKDVAFIYRICGEEGMLIKITGEEKSVGGSCRKK